MVGRRAGRRGRRGGQGRVRGVRTAPQRCGGLARRAGWAARTGVWAAGRGAEDCTHAQSSRGGVRRGLTDAVRQVFMLEGLLSALPDPAAAGAVSLDSSECSCVPPSCLCLGRVAERSASGSPLAPDTVRLPAPTPRYYSCDHSSDYIGSPSNLTGDGVIYPAYTPFSGAEAGNSTSQLYGLDIDHTGTVRACVRRARLCACVCAGAHARTTARLCARVVGEGCCAHM